MARIRQAQVGFQPPVGQRIYANPPQVVQIPQPVPQPQPAHANLPNPQPIVPQPQSPNQLARGIFGRLGRAQGFVRGLLTSAGNTLKSKYSGYAIGVASAIVGGLAGLNYVDNAFLGNFLWKDEVVHRGELNDGRNLEYVIVKGLLTTPEHNMTEWKSPSIFYELVDTDSLPLKSSDYADLERIIFNKNGRRWVFEKEMEGRNIIYSVDGERKFESSSISSLATLFDRAEKRYNHNRKTIKGLGSGLTSERENDESKLYDELATYIPGLVEKAIMDPIRE